MYLLEVDTDRRFTPSGERSKARRAERVGENRKCYSATRRTRTQTSNTNTASQMRVFFQVIHERNMCVRFRVRMFATRFEANSGERSNRKCYHTSTRTQTTNQMQNSYVELGHFEVAFDFERQSVISIFTKFSEAMLKFASKLNSTTPLFSLKI